MTALNEGQIHPSSYRQRSTFSLGQRTQAKVYNTQHSQVKSTRPIKTRRAQKSWAETIDYHTLQANLTLERLFRKHGRYVSRHPIQTLLVACLLITSLFYPAVGIYLWSSKGGPGVTRGDAKSVWRSLSTPLLDSFVSSGRKHHNSLRDLRMIWDDAPDLRAIDMRDSGAYTNSMAAAAALWIFGQTGDANSVGPKIATTEKSDCRGIRVEHVFVTTEDVLSGMGPKYGTLHTPILRSALNLQQSIEAVIGPHSSRTQGTSCVRSSDGSCLLLSPLSFWDSDMNKLVNDEYPTSTILKAAINTTSQGVPLTLSTTLAGRSHLFQHLPRADHLALTFFLEEEGLCENPEESSKKMKDELHHKAWLRMLRNITGPPVRLLNSDHKMPKEVLLQFDPQYPGHRFPMRKTFLTTAYVGMFIWLTRNLVKMRKVHSRFGLAFTASIELIISMTMAISICALSGVRLTLLPWEILPFVIVVIGSENMFALTNAIISTPATLTVSSRIAIGLERVGVPIIVTVLSDVVLMGLIATFVDVRAVRDFCVFAIFTLVVDFFMQMTFYLTVLSIDLQRLELADLLSLNQREGLTRMPSDEDASKSDSAELRESTAKDHSSPGRKSTSLLRMSFRALWRGRTARTASLFLLLGLMIGIYLYHGSGYPAAQTYTFASPSRESASVSSTEYDTSSLAPFDPFSHLSADGSSHSMMPSSPWWYNSPSALFWQALNPRDSPTIRLLIEPWTVVSLPSATSDQFGRKRNFASWAIFRPRVRAFIWFFKLVVLPIAGTTALLWIVLLYLLKDTELLEAQQNKQEAIDEDEDVTGEESILAQHEKNPHLKAKLYISPKSHLSDVTLMARTSSLAVSVSADGSLLVWKASKKHVQSTVISLKEILGSFATATALQVNESEDILVIGHADGNISILSLSTLQHLRDTRSKKAHQGPTSVVQRIIIRKKELGIPLLTFHRDGSVWGWTSDMNYGEALVYPEEKKAWRAFNVSQQGVLCQDIVALVSRDGHVKLFNSESCKDNIIDIATGIRDITAVGLSPNVLNDKAEQTERLITFATREGDIIVFDCSKTRKVAQLQTFNGPVSKIYLLDESHSTNGATGSLTDNKLIVSISMGHVTVLRLSKTPIHSVSNTPVTSLRQRSSFSLQLNDLSVPALDSLGSTSVDSTQSFNGHPYPRKPSYSKSMGPFLEGNISPGPLPRDESRDEINGTEGLKVASNVESEAVSDEVTDTALSLTLIANIGCYRGGADVVLREESAIILGVRQKTLDFRTSQEDRSLSRWEAFCVRLGTLAASHTPNGSSDHLSPALQRVSLLLEGNFGGDERNFSNSTDALDTIATDASFRTTHSRPGTISFTRLDRVQSFDQHTQSGNSKAIGRPSISFSFGNAVGIITLRNSYYSAESTQ